MKNKLTRDTKNKMIAGVMSGLANYWNQDVVLFRLIGVAAFIFSGFVPFGVLYIVAWIIMPTDNPGSPEYTVVE